MQKIFFERFKRLSEMNNTTVNAVAKELGLSSGSVTAWKNGTEPNSTTVLRIAKHFNVTTDYLLGIETQTVGQRLRTLRHENSITLEGVEAILNIKKAIYVSYEQDKRELPHEILVGIAEYFGVYSTWILTGVGPKMLTKARFAGVEHDDGDFLDIPEQLKQDFLAAVGGEKGWSQEEVDKLNDILDTAVRGIDAARKNER